MLLKLLVYSSIAMILSITTFNPSVFVVFFTVWFIIVHLNIFKRFGKNMITNPLLGFGLIVCIINVIIMWINLFLK